MERNMAKHAGEFNSAANTRTEQCEVKSGNAIVSLCTKSYGIVCRVPSLQGHR